MKCHRHKQRIVTEVIAKPLSIPTYGRLIRSLPALPYKLMKIGQRSLIPAKFQPMKQLPNRSLVGCKAEDSLDWTVNIHKQLRR